MPHGFALHTFSTSALPENVFHISARTDSECILERQFSTDTFSDSRRGEGKIYRVVFQRANAEVKTKSMHRQDDPEEKNRKLKTLY